MATLTYGNVVGAGPGWTAVTTPTGTKTVVGDRATRNNNPGNIEAGNYANSMGAIGTDGRFAVFGSRLTGTRAQAGLIFGKNYRNLTLRQAIAKYAPEFENNTTAYAAAVAAAAGVSLDTKMKDIPADKQAAVVAGMQAVEGNTGAKAYDAYGNLTDTLDTTSQATPRTAPTPYGRNSQQALASTRPDNFSIGGPKGLFNVDSQVAKAIGHVSRSPLGPVAPSVSKGLAPSRPNNLGGLSYSSPKGTFSVGATSAKSPSRPDTLGGVHMSSPVGMGGPGGLYADAQSAAAANAATSAEASKERAAARAATAAPAAPGAPPSNPSTLGGMNYSSPKGVFSVDPGAKVRAEISPTAAPAATIGPAAPTIGMPATPRPALAPVPAAVPAVVSPPKAIPAAVAPSVSRQSLAPARPALSPADVYGGAVGTAQTSTPGTTVSRATSYGPTYTTNKFGAVTATAPDGTQMAAWGGVPTAKPAISGPLSQTGITTPAAPTTSGMFGPKAKSATGMVTGAAIGGYALGPLGAMLGGLIGKNVAQGKAPLSGLLGGSTAANTHMVDTFDGPMRFANAKGGLGFPSAPANPGGYSPTSSNRSAAGMRSMSPGAASAIGKGQGGLY